LPGVPSAADVALAKIRACLLAGRPDPHAKLWRLLEFGERRALCQKAGLDPELARRQWDSFDAAQCAAIGAAWRRWRDRVLDLAARIA
jgi:hypothetical protein